MYFCYAPKLNPPDWLKNLIVEEINNGQLMPTGMNRLKNLPTLNEQQQAYIDADPEAKQYHKKTYYDSNILGFYLNQHLETAVLNHYQNFLDTVPDVAKLTVVQITSSVDEWKIHVDPVRTASLFCLIKNTNLSRTTWWEPTEKYTEFIKEKNQNWQNKKNIPVFKHWCVPKTSVWAQEGEMILFDHNAIHSVDEIVPHSDRYILSIGFANISHDQLVDCYHRWAASSINN